ncbi:Integral membrane protein, partial [Pseudolycoriella hygida]
MNDLYPALVQCFGIIICGLKIISNAETKGLNTFVGTFALPCLIFLSLVELNWQKVNWKFLAAMLIAKAIVFFAVCIISLLVTKPLNYGRAGILATFCTQSNDFAIGYPIVVALYQKVHPEYASYLYLMAPISLAILNPIGYVLMEISNIKNQNPNALTESTERRPSIGCPQVMDQPTEQTPSKNKYILIVKTMRSIFFNPILLMTVLGVIGGFAFPEGLPTIVSGVLRVFGNSFSATALFLLGLRMLGKARELQGAGFLTPGVLILVKLLVLPLVNRQTVNIMKAGANMSDTTDLSTFGFLYGTIPAAPGVFVIATQYKTDVDLIASSMVACTFISGPLLFISAKMISLTNLNPADYLNELDHFAFDISIVGIIACFWILLLFGVSKRFKRIPHRITCCLVLSQLLGCVGVILWSTLGSQPGWQMYLQFSLFAIGNYSCRLWAALLAISLLFLQCRSLCFVLKLWPVFISIAWGVPIVLVVTLLLLDQNNISTNEKRNPNFQYGNAQAAVSIFLLVMCFIVTSGCLVLHQRYKKRFEKYLSLSKEVSLETESSTAFSESTSNLIQSNSRANVSDLNFTINNRVRLSSTSDDEESNCSKTEDCCTRKSTATTVVDIEDLMAQKCNDRARAGSSGLCSSQFNCDGTSRENCQTLVKKYQTDTIKGLEPLEFPENVDEYQTMRHTVLLILLLCSMFVSLALSIWTLVMEGMSACFITDSGELWNPIAKYWHKIWYGANILLLPDWNSISIETKHICDQFTNYHLDACRKAITEDKRWRIKIYKKVFYGNRFVDYLIEVGLARDRVEAIQYARHLIDGRVLRHINNVYHFHDKNLLYTFCNRFSRVHIVVCVSLPLLDN